MPLRYPACCAGGVADAEPTPEKFFLTIPDYGALRVYTGMQRDGLRY